MRRNFWDPGFSYDYWYYKHKSTTVCRIYEWREERKRHILAEALETEEGRALITIAMGNGYEK